MFNNNKAHEKKLRVLSETCSISFMTNARCVMKRYRVPSVRGSCFLNGGFAGLRVMHISRHSMGSSWLYVGAVYELRSLFKGTLLGAPNKEPQEYNRNIIEYNDPGKYLPIIFLLYVWGSLLGVHCLGFSVKSL